MALLTRKQAILIESEGSYNASTTPTGADALLVTDLEITPQSSDVVSREYVRPYFGASEQLLANTKVEITFGVELVASGTAGTAPGYSKALLACGLLEEIVADTSVTYTPKSSAFSSATIWYYLEDVRHKISGARGTFTLEASVGEIPKLNFSFTGIYNAPDSHTLDLSTVTYNEQPTPLILKDGNTSGFNIIGHQAGLNSLSLDMGNEIVYREVIGGTPSKEVLLSNRAVTGSATIDAVGTGTKDFFAAALADSSLGALTLLHGASAGNRVQVVSSKCDIGDVSYGESDGIATMEIPFTLVPSATGNDEVALVYT
tara:strand:- start:3990 stop:4937 length:948 start_codon:yes stop_codon:yes gene_type:complete